MRNQITLSILRYSCISQKEALSSIGLFWLSTNSCTYFLGIRMLFPMRIERIFFDFTNRYAVLRPICSTFCKSESVKTSGTLSRSIISATVRLLCQRTSIDNPLFPAHFLRSRFRPRIFRPRYALLVRRARKGTLSAVPV